MAGAGGRELFCSEDTGRWRASLDSYDEVRALLVSSKKRGTSSTSGSLTALDKWYQTELPVSIASRSKPHLTHEELCKLMKWKLTRGKFRPRLMEMVQENSPDEVERATGAAISALPDLEKAVTLASKLRAVGPATASAILCAASSDVPFMADESALSVVPSLGKLTYSLKQYLTYAKLLQEKARQLSREEGGGLWTAHDVELAIWSHYHFTTTLSHTQTPPRTLGKRRRKDQQDSEETSTTTGSKRAKLSNSTS